ncbi:CIN85 and CD2AP related isoform X3 [Rhodnius prolixus]|uniref:CIN85 and CD2AP related isoform X3 n=1 Tax=Rhodnius prolixus TaxID=13249 RepID=UPI003D187AF9
MEDKDAFMEMLLTSRQRIKKIVCFTRPKPLTSSRSWFSSVTKTSEALVEFDYKAHEPDELTIKKGDIITDISFKTGGWWEGTLSRSGKRGMFPDNFVKLITDAEGETVQHAQPPRKCKVLFHYKPANEDELELQVGDIIDVISEVEEGWWKGKLKNRIGVFPSNFVCEIGDLKNETREAQRRHKLNRDDSTKQSISLSQEHLTNTTTHSSSHTSYSQSVVKTSSTTGDSADLPMLPPKPIKEMCRAMFHYEAANADELTLHEGDIITIITKEGQDPGWWKGELKGKLGVFPDNFVQIITTPSEEAKPDRPSKALTTNKLRDHITKSATTSNMTSSLTGVSRKFSEPTKPSPSAGEEKSTHTHPSLSKKPVLPPPPMKKPQRSSSDLSKSPTTPSLLSSKLLESSSGGVLQMTTATSRGSNSSSVAQSTLCTVETSSSSVSSSGRWTVLHESASSTASGTVNSNNASSITNTINTNTSDKTATNDKPDGPFWSRHRTSYTVSSSHASESNSVALNSGGDGTATSQSQPPPSELDLDLVGRAAMLTHPTANRAKLPKRRPPSGVINKDMSQFTDGNSELELDNDVKNGEDLAACIGNGGAHSAEIETSPTALTNGDADTYLMDSVMVQSRSSAMSKTAPWVEELKLSQAKKSMQAAGKTRVMIGPSPTSDASSAPLESSVSNSKLQQSVATTTISATTTSTTSLMSTSLVGAVTLRNTSSGGQQRPQSMISSLRSSISSSDSLMGVGGGTGTSTLSSTSPQDTVTVTLRQWTELNDKLSRLELYFESQISTLTKSVKDLTGKLDEEKQRRQLMQQELEKLTDLVTQV